MKRITCKISLGNFIFNQVSDVSINSTWEELTDTCNIRFAKKLTWKEEDKNIVAGADSLFRRGDAISMQLGYENDNILEFQGVITGIKPGLPLQFSGQDEMWQLKQESFSKSYKSVTLNQLLTDICPLEFQAADVQLGKFRISKVTCAQVLEELKKEYSIYSFVREGKLYSGLAYWPELQKEYTYQFERDIIDDGENLEYRRTDDVKIKVNATSILPDNTKIEITVGDTEGETRSLTYYNIATEKELKARAEAELVKFKYEGFYGYFSTFGDKSAKHGDIANLIDLNNPERSGRYLIKKVVKNFGQDGFKQTIHLDAKI